jgi:tetratricopeptide (TPR) repeat protein
VGARLLGLARALTAWADNGIEPARQDILEMFSSLPDRWDAWLEARPESCNYHVLSMLLDAAARNLREEMVHMAALLTHFVTEHIDRVVAPPELFAVRERLRARSWYERGRALRAMGELPEARQALERAMALMEGDPLAVLPLAAARREHAVTLHARGDSDAALRVIREDIPLFLRCADVAGAIHSLMAAGQIELECGSTTAARKSFDDAFGLAALLKDHRTMTSLMAHLGHTAEAAGDDATAISWYHLSVNLLVVFGMLSELARVKGGLARIIARSGAVDEAVDRMLEVYEELQETGTPAESAAAALQLVETLHLAEDPADTRTMARELADFFGRRGLVRQAMQALSVARQAPPSTRQSETTPDSSTE